MSSCPRRARARARWRVASHGPAPSSSRRARSTRPLLSPRAPARYEFVKLAGVLLAALSNVFLALTALSDPGVFKRQPRPLAPDWTYAEFADSYRPPGTVFCHMTKVLIEEYDHFCPWSGTVIGKKNMLWFKLWISTLIGALCLDLGLIAGYLLGDPKGV